MDKIKIPSFVVDVIKEATEEQKNLELRKAQLLSLYLKANDIEGQYGLSEDQEWLVLKPSNQTSNSDITK